MAIDLLADVEAMTINLTRNTDFIRRIETVSPEVFPVGCVVELRWYQSNGSLIDTWAATVTSTQADWNVDKADVDTLIALVPDKAKLFYIDGTVDLLWALANTVVIDG
jgi:hypothetical protein